MAYINFISEKICRICGILKTTADNFGVVNDHKDDLVYRNVCKECISKRDHERYLKNQGEIKANRKTEEYKLSKKIWDKNYNEKHPEKIKKKKKKYYQENKEEILAKNTEYQKENKSIRNNREKARKQKDPAYKLRTLVSSRISAALKSAGASKSNTTFTKYVPYTMQDLQEHLTKQFEPWMTWQNWGKYNAETWNDNDQSTWTWQLDHIIPRSELPYSSMEDENFHKCWALENLRPLSAKQNIIEGSTRVRHKQ
jgi:hypothetical protein